MRGGSSFISELVGGLTVHTGSDFNNRAERSNNVVSVMRRGKTDAVEGEGGWGDETQRKRLEKLKDWNSVYFATFGTIHVFQPPQRTQSQWTTIGRRRLEVLPILIY